MSATSFPRLPLLMRVLVPSLLTIPLLAVLFAAYAVVGVEYAPFALFDWLARILPGPVVTFGIDLIVGVIRGLNLGPTDTTAKVAEQIMAILLTFVVLTITGALFLTFSQTRKESRRVLAIGLALGLGAGVTALLIIVSLNRTLGWAQAIFLLTTFTVWGTVHSYALLRLRNVARVLNTTNTSRRQFLIQIGGVSTVITVVGAGLSTFLSTRLTNGAFPLQAGLPEGSTLPPPTLTPSGFMPAEGTRPEITPVARHYRIDINSGAPQPVDPATYRLRITGLVENPVELSLDDVHQLGPALDQYITMSCISNPIGGDLIGTTRWTGVSMQHLLDRVLPKPGATHILITGMDGFYEIVALSLIRSDPRVMLTYAWDGQLLPVRNGFPLRIHVPDHYGMKQPKWITGMEFISAWEPGYWVARGWDQEARVRATSVIDTVAVDARFTRDGMAYIPVGGIAWAGTRGISRVQVKSDEGEWVDAQLGDPLSDKTWVLWRYDWPYQPGPHTFAVRCVEKDGAAQIEETAGVRPSGATGLHEHAVNL
ncbi:MAG: molybdopterin-dependent oxidoreductase [Anaerolineae bacterium]|nr:molybdopterin-dependent oxidoreductase [Anaerolineae bacterium]